MVLDERLEARDFRLKGLHGLFELGLVVWRWLAQFVVEDIHLKEDRIQRIADFMGQGTREAPEHGELRIASEACFQEGHLSYDDHHPSFNAMEVEHRRALYMLCTRVPSRCLSRNRSPKVVKPSWASRRRWSMTSLGSKISTSPTALICSSV
jgi:hypothetical protein